MIYTEEEVFKGIKEFLNATDEMIDEAFTVHRKIINILPKDIMDIYYFRYLNLGGTIGLNINNYKIYEYHHEKNHSYRFIYPDDKLDEIKNSDIKCNVDFKFISIPCSLLEIPVEEFNKFTSKEWNNFITAVEIASNGKVNDKNIRNIDINWED